MEVDTGTSVTTMSLVEFKKKFPKFKAFETADVTLITANGENVKPKYFVEVQIKSAEDREELLRLYLINGEHFPALIGSTWLRKLNIDIIDGKARINNLSEKEVELKELMQ